MSNTKLKTHRNLNDLIDDAPKNKRGRPKKSQPAYKPPEVKGFFCVGCGSKLIVVVDSRPILGGIRRRRRCIKCNYTFSTREFLVTKVN